MEIEKKYLIKELPFSLEDYPSQKIEQGYLCVDPVVRIRRSNDDYYLTYKSSGLMAREEYNLPLTREAYDHLRPKIDGHLISKTRYLIPYQGLTIELDDFHIPFDDLLIAEVEFATEEEALTFIPPKWFGEDVTFSTKYHNSALSQLD